MGCAAAIDDKLRAEPVFYHNKEAFYDFGESDSTRLDMNISTQNNEEIRFMIDRDAECAFHTRGVRSFPVDIIGTYKSIPTLLFKP